MANRFETAQPIRSSFIPKEFMPNFEGWRNVLANQQQSWDFTQQAAENIPQHLQVDNPDVMNYVNTVKTQLEDVASSYQKNGVLEGNRAKKTLLQSIRRDWMPGGKAYNFQKNQERFQAYAAALDEMYKKGDINVDKKNQLLALSAKQFGKSYDDQNNYKEFSGIDAAKDQDLTKQALEIADGWMANEVAKGTFKVMNGQYFNMVTHEFVDLNEVVDNVYASLIRKPENIAFARQEAMLRGYEGEEAVKYIDDLFKTAATTAGNKEAYDKYKNDIHKDWAAEEAMKQRNRKELEDYKYEKNNPVELTSDQFTLFDPSNSLVNLDAAGNISIKENTTYRPPQMVNMGAPATQTKVIKKSLKEFAETPEGLKKHPGLADMIKNNQELFGLQKKSNGKYETIQEQNQRIAKAYNDRQQKLSQTNFVGKRFNPDEIKEETYTVIGSGNQIGNIIDRTVYFASDKKVGPAKSFQNVLKDLRMTPEEFIKNARVVREVRADNPFAPSGEMITVVGKKGEMYNLIVGNINNQDEQNKQGVFNMAQVGFNPNMTQSQWQDVPLGNGYSKLRTVAVDKFNPDSTFDRRELRVEVADLDENGNFIIDPKTGQVKAQPAPFGLEEILQGVDNVNIASPTYTDPKKLKR